MRRILDMSKELCRRAWFIAGLTARAVMRVAGGAVELYSMAEFRTHLGACLSRLSVSSVRMISPPINL